MLIIQWYSSHSISIVFNENLITSGYLTISILITLQFIVGISYKIGFNFVFSSLMILVVFQLVIIPFLLIEDTLRIINYGYFYFFDENEFNGIVEFSQRRKFISQFGLLIATIPVGALLIGIIWGKYNFRIINHKLSFENLPENFDGFKIAHISDFHLGNFKKPEKVKYGLDLIQKQNVDLILFTGDMVNNLSKEVNDFKEMIGALSAKYGKFSVLGNHDYGDYITWESDFDKIENLNNLKKIQKEMGFKLLLNESVSIYNNNSKIDLIGVENWGNGFKKKGDLNLALKDYDDKSFKLLLSHDPTHWEEKVLNHKAKIDLTLSGHTHGMQFGIEIPGLIKWSPAKFKYKYWAGIYEINNQILNVNRGFGVLAYPGRFGIYPEISIITLKKAKT